MRILLVSSYVGPGAGGQEKIALDQALGFSAAGHEVVIVGPYSNSHALRSRIPPSIPLYEEPWELRQGQETHLQLFRTTWRAVRAHRIEVVSGHGRMFGVYVACRMAGVPLVWTLHGFDPDPFLDRPTLRQRAIRRLFQHLAADAGVLLVAVSDFTRRNFAQIVHQAESHRVVTIRPGPASVSDLLTLPLPEARDRLRIGFVGRLEEIKGVRDLLEIAQGLRDRKMVFSILVYGNGTLEQSLRSDFARAGFQEPEVCFRGYEPDVMKIYSTFDVTLHLSVKDALPLTTAESIAAGRPVIAYDAGGVPEVVHHGRNGILCKPGVVKEIVDALEHVSRQPGVLKGLAAEGRPFVGRCFSAERMIGDYIDLFSTIRRPAGTGGHRGTVNGAG